MRIARWLAPLLALALLAAACGNDDGDDGSSAAPTSTAEPSPTEEPTADAGDAEATAEPTAEVAPASCATQLSADGPVQIDFWHAMSGTNGEVLSALIDEYNASQDAVEVNASYQGEYQETFDKYVNTLRSSGQLPALIQLEEVVVQQMVDSQSVQAVQECVDADGYDTSGFTSGLVEQYSVDGVLVSMPFQLSNPVFYYDATDFEAAGLDPEAPPTTLEELLDVSRALVDSGVVDRAFALNTNAWFFEEWVGMTGEPIVDNDNGREERATAALLESEGAAEVMDFLATMRDEGLLLDTGRAGEGSALNKFIAVGAGNAAMAVGTSAALGEIYSQIGSFPGVDLRVSTLPGSTDGGNTVAGGSLYLIDGLSDAEQAAVWDLMKWLNEPAQQAAWAVGTGYVPTVTSALDDPDLQARWAEIPGYRVAYDQILSRGEAGPLIGPYPTFRAAIDASLQQLVDGADPAAALAAAQSEADAAIADYNRRIGE